jgi:hypothetical protein
MRYVLAFLFLFQAGGALAGEKIKSGEVNFLAKGNPGFMKIEGQSSKGLSGELDSAGGIGSFSFDLTAIETGIELRDEHMKEKYLEVKKHPRATLVLKSIEGFTGVGAKSKGTFTGILTLHGVSNEVSGTYEMGERKLLAKFPLKISDYKIDVPSWMGVTVADSVDITVTSKF